MAIWSPAVLLRRQPSTPPTRLLAGQSMPYRHRGPGGWALAFLTVRRPSWSGPSLRSAMHRGFRGSLGAPRPEPLPCGQPPPKGRAAAPAWPHPGPPRRRLHGSPSPGGPRRRCRVRAGFGRGPVTRWSTLRLRASYACDLELRRDYAELRVRSTFGYGFGHAPKPMVAAMHTAWIQPFPFPTPPDPSVGGWW